MQDYCLIEMSCLGYFDKLPRQNSTGLSEQSCGSGTITGFEECVVLLEQFSLIDVGIKNPSFIYDSKVLLKLAEVHFKKSGRSRALNK